MTIDNVLFESNERVAKCEELLSVIDFDFMHEVAKIYAQSFLVDPDDYDDAHQRMSTMTSDRSKKFARSRLRKALRLTSDLSTSIAKTRHLKTESVRIDSLNESFEVINDHRWRRVILSGFRNPHEVIANKAQFYRDPSSIKYRTYMLACHIYRYFLNIKLTIDDLNDLILYKQPANDALTVIKDVDIDSFAGFLVKNISKNAETEYIVSKAVKMLLSNKDQNFRHIMFYYTASHNRVIQFKDCYLEKGEFFAGQYTYIPAYWIDRCVWPVVQNDQPSRVVSAVDDLLFNICNNQSFDMEVLLSRLSTFMLNDRTLKRRINFAPRAVVIYDKHDKSNAIALMRLLQSAVGDINCVNQTIKDFGASTVDYFKERSARALIIVDKDGMSSKPSRKSKELMGYFMQGNEVRATGSYGGYYRLYHPSTSVISYTHSKKTLVDSEQHDHVEWRFEIFDKSRQLSSDSIKTHEWFKALETDEAAQYLLELLVLMHLDNMRRYKLLRRDYKKLSELED